MVIRYQPGQPNPGINAFSSVIWRDIRLIVYCSGNNLIILQDPATLLQTVYVPSDIYAVAIESDRGLIAASYGNKVLLLEPTVFFDKPPKWHEFATLNGKIEDGSIKSVCWGYSGIELATGSLSLSIWSIDYEWNQDHHLVWSHRVANCIDLAQFSPDAYLIATAFQESDLLVKLWRRSSYDILNVTFDFNYLPHPQPVVKLWWKTPYFKDQSIKNTLYTIAMDGVLRIWSECDSSDVGNLQLWGVIDHVSFSFMPAIYDSSIIKRIVELLVSSGTIPSILIPRLVELAKLDTDICILFDSSSNELGTSLMSVYSIENGALSASNDGLLKITPLSTKKVMNYRVAPKYPKEFTSIVCANSEPLPPFHSSSVKKDLEKSDLQVLIHDYVSASLKSISVSLLDVLASSLREPKVILHYVLTGHYKSVQNIVRSSDGDSLFSQSRFSENILWKPTRLSDGGVSLTKCCYIKARETRVVLSVLMRFGKFVITLLETNQIVLWDCTSQKTASEVYSVDSICRKPPLCAFFLPQVDKDGNRDEKNLVIVYSSREIYIWTVDTLQPSIKLLREEPYSLPYPDNYLEELHMAVVVDPVGWHFTIGEGVDSFSRDVLTTLSNEGVLRSWTAGFVNGDISWLQTSVISVEDSGAKKAQVSSTRKAAIASSDGKTLRIWDTRNGVLEYHETFESPDSSEDYHISDLDWTTTPDNQCVLGVGFNLRVVILYCQQRYDYTNDTPSWAPFRKVDISQYTNHQIGDSIWLSNGTFVVGAGNQLFIQDEKVDMNDETTKQLLGSRNTTAALENSNSIFDICSVMNGPLPLYHPQLLIQMVFSGNMAFATEVLVLLLEKVKFASVFEPSMVVDITSQLDITPETLSLITDSAKPNVGRQGINQFSALETKGLQTFSPEAARDLVGWLQKYSLPYLTRHQQITLVSVVEALSQMLEDIRSLDENGMKFLLGYKLFTLHRGSQKSMTMRDFSWALHSDTHSILIDLVTGISSTGRNAILWPAMRDLGFAFWLTNDELRGQMEALAQNSFNIDNKRDPVRCSLYYLALKKKNVLVGLWRITNGNKEQAKTLKLLSNDFSTARWKSAALKNAFALLGKHRFEYAAAFFLLGNSLRDAVNVIIKNIQDISLAIAIARVYEGGDTGPVFQGIIKEHILPQASFRNDKWLVSWGHWMLGQQDLAVRSLVGDLFSMGLGMRSLSSHATPNHMDGSLSVSQSPAVPGSVVSSDARSFLVDDPVLIHLYRDLRDKHLVWDGDMDGMEYRFVLKVCSIYSRMGCDILALQLLKYWSFGYHAVCSKKVTNETTEPLEDRSSSSNDFNNYDNNREDQSNTNVPSILDNFSGNGISDQKTPSLFNKKPPATAFQEPDMSAFSFGF